MLIGPPWPMRVVAMFRTVEIGTPLGNMLASRLSATLQGGAHFPVASGTLITTGGKLVSCGAVLSRLLADGRASGVRAIELEVDEGHEPAGALYRSLGFEANKRTPWVLDLRR